MNELLQIIDHRIQKQRSSTTINSLPCKVISFEGNMVTVELTSNGAQYCVPNYSGSAVAIGENVLLYYTGSLLSANNAYVGASITKDSTLNIGCLTGKIFTGEIFESGREIARINFSAYSNTVVQIIFNYTFYGTSNQPIRLRAFLKRTQQVYSPIISVATNEYLSGCLNLPIPVIAGDYDVIITGEGSNVFVDGQFNIVGHSITIGQDYEPTTDNDYIFETINDTTNIIYYVGESLHPAIPNTLNNIPVKIIRSVGFNNKNVETIYIPYGVEEIE